ncbi:response regulator [Marinobacter sp. NSM]|uniref:response regulator n=1 Tax=Marinobacter sp. NSM TaxID=3458004 RepID=UPI00403683EC
MIKKLVIVDDEEHIIKSLERLFRKEDYEVVGFLSPIDALEYVRTNEISVVLSDQRMPGMLGSDMLSEIKKIRPNCIRIIMSGYTELESVTSAINDGAVFKFLTKPWDDEKLIRNISEAFEIFRLKENNKTLTMELQKANRELSQRLSEESRLGKHHLKASQISYALIDVLPFAVFAVDTSGLIVFQNNYSKSLFEISLGDYIAEYPHYELVSLIEEARTKKTIEFASLDTKKGKLRFRAINLSADKGIEGIVLIQVEEASCQQ